MAEVSSKGKKMDDAEVIVDPHMRRDFQGEHDQEDIDGHRKHIYVGIHVPKPKRHRHRRSKRNKGNHEETNGVANTDSEAMADTPLLDKVPAEQLTPSVTINNQIAPPSYTSLIPPSKLVEQPSARVKFLLGDEADEEHESHEIFTEMEELYQHGDEETEWKETARWIKYEEDVDVGADRWSKPHVSSLPLHSLFELRSCIMNGAVCLDMDAETLEQIAGLVLDKLIAGKQMEESKREQVREALLRRHHHQCEKKHRDRKIPKTSSLLPSIRSLTDIGRSLSGTHTNKSMEQAALEENGNNGTDGKISKRGSDNKMCKNGSDSKMDKSSSNQLSVEKNGTSTHLPRIASATSMKHKHHFMKKIPPGAEASNVLVGEVDFLVRPIIAFVRLARAVFLGDLTEVPIPTRFLFIMLGPHSEDENTKYHEIGRCIATLMSDEIFHDVAYKAKNTEDLLAGIDEFLDQVTVLPPGVWDPNIRIEPPKQAPSQNQREQRLSHVSSSQAVIDGHISGGGNGGGTGSGSHGGNEHGEDEAQHEGLDRTGRIFGGLIQDIRRRAPHYLSDFTDSLHIQCVASFIFMYFACITPVITFGGLLGEATNDDMATLESLLGAAICGIGFAIFSGQPLTILGSTGPILVYEKILVSFCESSGLDYLPFRLWIGLWTCMLCIVLVATDMSSMVRYFTRFTEESFSSLISFIFIYESLHKLEGIYEKYPIKRYPSEDYSWYCECGPGVNATNMYNWTDFSREECKEKNGTMKGLNCNDKHPPRADIFLMSAFLMAGTFFIAYSLKEFRTSRYFPTKVRQTVSDFSVLVAVMAMIGVDVLFGVPTPKLPVPSEFMPTNPNRKTWYIHPFGNNPWWTAPAAILPALLATILIFMDQQITAVIVNRKENKLKKGVGYHLDLCVVALLLLLCSILGLPWFVAATVLSINHVNSLKVERAGAPGEKPKIIGAREQRVTGIVVFLLIGLAVLMTKILVFIPMPVLYGVFLFMGVSSLKGVQFVDRLNLLFMPGKHQPDYIYLRHVELKNVHIFTLIQLSCLVILWIIKSTKAALVFPIMVIAMVFVRKLMDYIFTQDELANLDDILPEVTKREKHDKKKEAEEAAAKAESMTVMPGRVQVPLSDGNLLSIPVANVQFLPDKANINISSEMAKTGIWKTMVANTGSYADIIARPETHNKVKCMDETDSKRKNKSKPKQMLPRKVTEGKGDTAITSVSPQDSPDHFIPNRKASATISGEVSVEVPKFYLGDSETAV